jgi:hypothetical protein
LEKDPVPLAKGGGTAVRGARAVHAADTAARDADPLRLGNTQ